MVFYDFFMVFLWFLIVLSWFFQRTGFQRTGNPPIFIVGHPSMNLNGNPSMNSLMDIHQWIHWWTINEYGPLLWGPSLAPLGRLWPHWAAVGPPLAPLGRLGGLVMFHEASCHAAKLPPKVIPIFQIATWWYSFCFSIATFCFSFFCLFGGHAELTLPPPDAYRFAPPPSGYSN